MRPIRLASPKAAATFYYFAITVMLVGGIVLLLLVGGILSIQSQDPLNAIINAQIELALFGSIGLVLVTSPFWLIPYVQRILRRKQAIKVGVSHHARNRAQEILSRLEILESSTSDEEQLKMIRETKASCLAMIKSLSDVIKSDGENIDYSLAMKESRKRS